MKNFIIIAGAVYVKTKGRTAKEVCTLQDSGELLSAYMDDYSSPGSQIKSHRLVFVRLPKKYGAKFLVFLTSASRFCLEDNLIPVGRRLKESLADECWLANKIEILEDCVRITMPDGSLVSFVEGDGMISVV